MVLGVLRKVTEIESAQVGSIGSLEVVPGIPAQLGSGYQVESKISQLTKNPRTRMSQEKMIKANPFHDHAAAG